MKYQVTREVLLKTFVHANDEAGAERNAAEVELDEWLSEIKSERIEEVEEAPRPLSDRLRHIADRYDMTAEDTAAMEEAMVTFSPGVGKTTSTPYDLEHDWEDRFHRLDAEYEELKEKLDAVTGNYDDLRRKYDKLCHKLDMAKQYLTRD